MRPLKQVEKLVPYVPGKPVEELERELGITDAIKIASNENPLGPSPLAVEAIDRAKSDINRYPDSGCFYLKQKLSENLGVEVDNIIVGNGSNEVIEVAARTYLSSLDEAVYGEHAFIVYPLVTQSIGATHVVSPMGELKHDLYDIASRITQKTKVIFLANPNNPTGTIFKKDEFEWFLNEIPKEVMIIVDEAYFEYVEEEDYPNSLDYHGQNRNLITVRTFSKIYGLAGLRIGYGVASKEIISYLNRVREPFNVNSLAQAAAISALDDLEHVGRTRQENRRGLDFLYRELGDIGVSFIPSHTNFILIDLKEDPLPVYNQLLKEGVIVRPVGVYGLKTHLRVTVGLEVENRRFVEGLKKILGK